MLGMGKRKQERIDRLRAEIMTELVHWTKQNAYIDLVGADKSEDSINFMQVGSQFSLRLTSKAFRHRDACADAENWLMQSRYAVREQKKNPMLSLIKNQEWDDPSEQEVEFYIWRGGHIPPRWRESFIPPDVPAGD